MADVPETVAAILLTGHGGLEKLEYREDVPVPQAGPGEVVIQVAAAGVNNTDINTRFGWYSKRITEGTKAAGGNESPETDLQYWCCLFGQTERGP